MLTVVPIALVRKFIDFPLQAKPWNPKHIKAIFFYADLIIIASYFFWASSVGFVGERAPNIERKILVKRSTC